MFCSRVSTQASRQRNREWRVQGQMAASEDDVSGKAKQLEIAVPRPLGLGLPRSALDPIPTVAVFDEGHAAPTQIVQNGGASTARLPARPPRRGCPQPTGSGTRRRGPADVSSSDTAGAAPISAGPRIRTEPGLLEME